MSPSLSAQFRLVLLASCMACLACFAGCENSNKAAVEADRKYQSALESRDGDAAAAMLSKESLAWLDSVVALARTAKRDELKSAEYAERFEALFVRLNVPPAQLKQIDGAGYWKYRVLQGWVRSRSNMGDRPTGKARIKGKHAEVLYASDIPDYTPFEEFVFENGQWKCDLAAAAAGTNDWLRNDPRGRSNMDRSLMEDLGRLTGKTATDAVWDPPK